MPGFITICPTQSHGGANNYSSAFLPAPYAGTAIGAVGIPARDARIPFIANTETPRHVQRLELDFIKEINTEQLVQTGPDHDLEGRIESFELAFRMQSEAPELQDILGESEATRKLYGIDDPITEDFGRQCLMARRLSERGVRFVQCSHTYKWDQHARLRRDHEQNAHEVDKPIAALLHDLKSRGLLKDTLVIWGGEFGRTPMVETNPALGRSLGRDHHPQAFSMWMAGGGIRPGVTYGATDELGFHVAENPVHVHDVQATILHCLGFDHERLTYHHAGRDFRLTDVHGHVVRETLA
jgi:hypothetical protein